MAYLMFPWICAERFFYFFLLSPLESPDFNMFRFSEWSPTMVCFDPPPPIIMGSDCSQRVS